MANSSTATGVDPEYSVYVGNLNPTTALSDMEDLIYELFLQAGPLDKVFIPYDKDTGKHKGYGFVEFLHKESIQYSINLMNGICLLDRYLIVRTVTQRHQSSAQTPTSRNSPSLVSSTTPGSSKMIVEDNPFHSQAKPLVKITLPPPTPSASSSVISLLSAATPGAASATSTIEGNPFLSPATTPGAPTMANPFLSPAMPLIKVSLSSPGTPIAATSGGVSTEFSQSPLTPLRPTHVQSLQCTTPVQPPTPLFPSAVHQQPVASNTPVPLLQEGVQIMPKTLPLNPFLEPNYSPTPTLPPNPFLQNLRCLPPLPPPPPPPLELTPPFAPPHFLPPPPPPQQTPPPLFLPPPPPRQTPPLAPPPPIPLFPSPLSNGASMSSSQSNLSSAQPLPLFPDLSSLPSQRDDSPASTIQSNKSAASDNSQVVVTFDMAHMVTSFQTPPLTPDNKPTMPTNNHMSHSGSPTGDFNSEIESEPPTVNGDDNNSWSQHLSGGDHKGLHKGRIHANDHPAWLKKETKAKLAQYHLETLAHELQMIKKSTNAS